MESSPNDFYALLSRLDALTACLDAGLNNVANRMQNVADAIASADAVDAGPEDRDATQATEWQQAILSADRVTATQRAITRTNPAASRLQPDAEELITRAAQAVDLVLFNVGATPGDVRSRQAVEEYAGGMIVTFFGPEAIGTFRTALQRARRHTP